MFSASASKGHHELSAVTATLRSWRPGKWGWQLQQNLTEGRGMSGEKLPPLWPHVTHCPKDAVRAAVVGCQLSETVSRDGCKLSGQKPGAGLKSSQAMVLTCLEDKHLYFSGEWFVSCWIIFTLSKLPLSPWRVDLQVNLHLRVRAGHTP